MKKGKLFRLLLSLYLIIAAFNFASCSANDDHLPTEEDVQVENPAGDNFFHFINKEWLASVQGETKITGYIYQNAVLLEEKVQATLANMEDFKAVKKSFLQVNNGGLDAYQQEIDSLINQLTGKVKTKKEAYRALGKCLGMGLIDRELTLSLNDKDNEIICIINMGADAAVEQAEDKGIYRSYKPKTFIGKRIIKLSERSRSAEDILSCIYEGIGIDKEYLGIMEGTIDEYLKELEKMSVNEIKDMIAELIHREFLPYGSDELAQKFSTHQTSKAYFSSKVNETFTYSLSYHYYHQTINKELKQTFETYGEEMRQAFAKRIENNEWLSEQTKQAALKKLKDMKFFFGGDDNWYEETFCTPKGESLLADLMEMKKSRIDQIKALLGKNKRDEALNYCIVRERIPLSLYNAFNVPYTNSIQIHPCYMIAPNYSPDMSIGSLYGLLYVIGHEMTHGFDLDGSLMDAEGNENNWWQAEDRVKFEALNKELIEQINTFEIAPGIPTDGNKTVTEDVADLGGLNIALDALTSYLKKNGASEEELQKEQKNFYEYLAMSYRMLMNQAAIDLTLSDIHSANHIRVNGMFQHMDNWYDLYNVVEGDSLYLPKEKRITIW
ncbi:MAG: M13-type metalloendopeptidase [Bacillota bacterium]|nr:M13-type metalloendopeptidase [Bacillota bacterium]